MTLGRTRLALAPLASAVLLLAGCGGSPNPGVARLSSSTPADTTAGASTSGRTEADTGAAGTGASSLEAAALAFTNCMRANGVPEFPDPTNGGGFLFRKSSGVDPSSPAFEAARAKCKRFLPAGPGSGPPASAKTLAHYLTVAQCMRRHGVPEFPDPRTTAPPNPRAALGSGGGVISDIEGVVFVFPARIDEQSPAFTHAAAVCAFPLHNH